MSHYNKWSGGYFYGTWKPTKKDKDKKKEGADKTPSYKDYWRGTYGKGYDPDDDYYDSEVVDYDTIYRNRYKSSIGYSGLGGSLGGSSYYGGYSYGKYGSSSYTYSTASKDTAEDFRQLSELITRSVREARDLIVILDFPFNIRITFSNQIDESTAPPNSRSIFVPTIYYRDKDKTAEDKVRTFCALAVHEAAHLKYTEYRICESFTKNVESSHTEQETQLISVLFNLIEDERIEDQLLKERPGYLDLIEKSKLYQYKKFMELAEAIKSTKASQFLLNLFKLIRFPKNVDMDIVKKYSELYETIGTIIAPLPDSTKQSCTASLEVFKEIEKVISADEFQAELKTSGISIQELFGMVSKAGVGSYQTISGGFDAAPEGGIIGKTSDILDSIRDKKTGKMLTSLSEGGAFIGSESDTFFTRAVGDRRTYERDKAAIARYIPGVRKLIKGYDKNFDFNIFGCRSGVLDTTKLAEAYQGIPHVYVRKGTVSTNKLAVVVLIDESGSMGWHTDCGETRMTLARRAAVLLNEALKNQPGVDLYIYGHSGDILYSGSTEINIYREGNSKINQYALGSSIQRSENRDGTAILEVATRVRKLTDEHILMFVISDGYPAAYCYHGESAIYDVRNKVNKVQKMNTDVIQISIEYIAHACKMFDKFIDISGDVANMSKNLSNTIKKLIIKNKKSTVTQ